jgi:dTDP-4-dehydrorhamnose reductase
VPVPPACPVPAVWAGPECSFLAVGDGVCDQLSLTGHDSRLDDIDRLASLGISAVRYPILWGRDRGTGEATDWAWAGERLERLATLGVEPVVALLHHGFGPAGADPFDPEWPEAFGRFAGEVAAHFPAVASFLPINEPLTTARFGGLYGWWPPYARDRSAFARLVLAQALAWLHAVRAIRAARPDARLLVNEDIGRTFGTEALQPTIDLNNERRWLTFDLLTGRVEPGHVFWASLAVDRQARAALDRLRHEPEPPDILGVDHYVTSDRFLDDRLDRYPASRHADDGGIRYADVELVRVAGYPVDGFERALADTWQRYRRPVALTEVQLAGEPQDQVGWWLEAWAEATAAAARGIPVAAVTAWSAFGAYDWASVLRNPRGTYEAGAFALDADGQPQWTELANAIHATADVAARRGAARPAPPHPRSAAGWWRREDRALFDPAATEGSPERAA